MFSLLASFKRMLSYLFGRGECHNRNSPRCSRTPFPTHHSFPILLPLPPPSAPLLPDFDFRPSDGFLAAMGDGAVFVVANPLDLALQAQNLMANVLVVEVRGVGLDPFMMWFRFDSAALATRGVSVCRLFSDGEPDSASERLVNSLGIDRAAAADGGVCGWVIDRKRT
jgi:hypothetical protein